MIFSVVTKHLNKEEMFNYKLKDEFLDLYKDKEFAQIIIKIIEGIYTQIEDVKYDLKKLKCGLQYLNDENEIIENLIQEKIK